MNPAEKRFVAESLHARAPRAVFYPVPVDLATRQGRRAISEFVESCLRKQGERCSAASVSKLGEGFGAAIRVGPQRFGAGSRC